tara:strand:- start:208 stop:1440 length:1233 start_codon:yes stop_codon:yes gene_type:complete
MKKRTLTEELNRMKGLMIYTNGNTNEKMLMESVNDHCTGSNGIDDVLIKNVSQLTNDPTKYNFFVKAHFGAAKSSSDVYKDVLTNLKSKVLAVMPENQKEALADGSKELSIIKIKTISSSASNYLNGPLVPTHWNKFPTQAVGGGYEGTVPNIKTPIKDSSDTDWKENEGYAKSRSTNFFNWIKKSGNKMGINIDPKLVEVTPKIYVMDTGGCTDETRDISKYKNSGQWIALQGTIELIQIDKEFATEETKDCLSGASITIGYIPDDTHSCDYAIFYVRANNVLIGVANLNNGDLDVAGKISKYTENRVSDGKKGGMRSIEFVLTDKQITEIAENSEVGRVALSIQGFPTTWYSSDRGYTKKGTTHSDTPTIVVKLNGEVKYNKKPQGEMKRMDTPVSTPIDSFIPCQLV